MPDSLDPSDHECVATYLQGGGGGGGGGGGINGVSSTSLGNGLWWLVRSNSMYMYQTGRQVDKLITIGYKDQFYFHWLTNWLWDATCFWVSANWLYLTGTRPVQSNTNIYIDGSMQERRNSIANALELRISCTNPSIYS